MPPRRSKRPISKPVSQARGRRKPPAADAAWLADYLAYGVLTAVALVALLTFRDYGLGWDDYTHAQYGDLLLKLYGSGFVDQRALAFVNLYYYGGGFDVAAALAAKVLPFGLFETRRLVGAAFGIAGLIATWRLGRRLGGPWAGLVALILLATCPLYDGHMYFNAKDAPFATAMIILLLACVRAVDEYPTPNKHTVLLMGVALGLAFGSRILTSVRAPCVFAALAMIVIVEARKSGTRAAAKHFAQFSWLMLPAALVGYLIMGLLWPWSVISPFNPLYASEYFAAFFEKPWRELYEGRLYEVTQMPLSYLPHLLLLKLPEIMLALGGAGAMGTFVLAACGTESLRRRACYVLVALAALFPVALAMVLHPALYNGLRHFIFVIPPFAVLGGLAGAWALEWARAKGTPALAGAIAVFLAGIALPIDDMIQLHPFQYTAFNHASGGVRMAHDRYMLDYWGLAFKQAGNALRARLDAAGIKHPPGRRWVVEVCGPQRPAEIALGPDFETTWDRQSADFAMMLGTYYCRDLNAPVLIEIAREGVDYARVYDIRGRRRENLLNEPPQR